MLHRIPVFHVFLLQMIVQIIHLLLKILINSNNENLIGNNILKDWTKKWRLAIWHPFGSSANFSLEFFSLVLECRTILVAETHQSDARCRMANADWFSLDTNKCIKGVNREENTVSCIVISECDALCEKFFF